jgi:hypothetical protein
MKDAQSITIQLKDEIEIPYEGVKWVSDTTGNSVVINFNSQTVAYQNSTYSLRGVNVNYITVEEL